MCFGLLNIYFLYSSVKFLINKPIIIKGYLPIVMMIFKDKIFDNILKLSFYLFSILAVFSMSVTLYDKYMGYTSSIELKPALIFLFFAFFAKYQYAIQYGLNRLEIINNKERHRQLMLDKDDEKSS